MKSLKHGDLSTEQWAGKVWLNPPYNAGTGEAWDVWQSEARLCYYHV
ncbi:MAG: hypothetical protein ACYDEF_08550 [Methanosarcina sp.]